MLILSCSLISLLRNKKNPRSLRCIIGKLWHKVYRYVLVELAVEEPVVEEPIELAHKIVQKCVTLILHNSGSKSIHARAAKLHTNKD